MTQQLREIAFDTETTGFNALEDDRIIELGAVELINHIPTGRTFQRRINPRRLVPAKVTEITGICDADLTDSPFFEDPDVVDAFLSFIGDSPLVAHNASFDRSFINAELGRIGRPGIPDERWIDTVMMARKRYPGAPASLDALCKRFDISLESRAFHGALLDSQLLASVYLELLGGRARAFSFDGGDGLQVGAVRPAAVTRPRPLASTVTAEEHAAHDALIDRLGPDALWKQVS